MPPAKSLANYKDVQDLFERALSEGELVIQCKTYGDAIVLRQRFNYFRKLDRDANTETYPVDHRMHGCSVYDSIKLVVPPKNDPASNFLTLTVRSASDYKVLTKEETEDLRAGLTPKRQLES